jgi:hypothetical protein
MKTLLKRIVILLYSLGLIKGSTVTRAFTRFDLWSA